MLPITTLLFPSCPDLLLEEITCEGQTLFLTVRSSRTLRKLPDEIDVSLVQKKRAVGSAAQTPLSAREAAWWFACNPQKLRIPQVIRLDYLRVTDEELGLAYQLAQDFRVMVTKRQVHVLGRWLEEAKSSDIKELQSLATGIYRDFDAVRAALATEYSNDHVA